MLTNVNATRMQLQFCHGKKKVANNMLVLRNLTYHLIYDVIDLFVVCPVSLHPAVKLAFSHQYFPFQAEGWYGIVSVRQILSDSPHRQA